MILIGHPYIDFKAFEKVENQADVKLTSANATVLFDFCEERVTLCRYLSENSVDFALVVKEEKEVIFASSLGASYIVCDKELANIAQQFADAYLFDAKILLKSNEDEDIVYAAKHNIDGVLFEKGVVDGSG